MGWWSDLRDDILLPAAVATGAVAAAPFTGGASLALGAGAFAATRAYQNRNDETEAERLARVQGEAGSAVLRQARSEREAALIMAMPGSDELLAQSRMLQLGDMVLGRSARELEYLARGEGGEGGGLYSQMIERQFAAEESRARANLQRRFGSGYETSSAGMAQIANIRRQKADTMMGLVPQFLGEAYQAAQAPATMEQIIKNRQVSAINATPITPYAAGPYVGQIQAGLAAQQRQSDILAGIFQIGAMGLGGWAQGGFQMPKSS